MSSKLKKIKDTYINCPVQLKASAWFFICSLAQKMISVVSTVIFTRIISTEDYGIISIYNSWSDILYIIATLNLATGVYNVGMTKYFEKKDIFNSSMQLLSLIWVMGFAIVFLFLYSIIGEYMQLPYSLTIVMLFTFFTMPAMNLWTAKQRFECKYRGLVLVTLSYSIVILLVSLCAVLCFENKSSAKIISNAVVTSMYGIVLFTINLKHNKKKLDKEYALFAMKFNIPMIPAFLSMVVLNQIDRIMISNQVSISKAGVYSVAYSAAMFISILSTAINATYNPWLMKKIHDSDFKNVSERSKAISVFFCGGLIFFVILAPELIKIMASSEYFEAVYIIPPVASSAFFTLIYTFFCPFAQYFVKMRFLVFVNIGVAVVNVVLNYIFIDIFSYLAAGYTTYFCYLLYAFGTMFYVNNLISREFKMKKVYDIRFFICLTTILTVVMIVINFLYRGYVFRYLIMLSIILVFIVNRKKLMTLKNILG